jgi:hypothetical protein
MFSLRWPWRMVSSGMLRRVVLVRTDVSEELSASFIRVTRIGELGTTLANASKLPLFSTPTNFPSVISCYSCCVIDMTQITHTAKWQPLPFTEQHRVVSWAGQTVFLPYWRISIMSRRAHPDTPMDPFRPLFSNIIHFLWIEINV